MANYIALADIIGRADFLELCCGRCERRGRLSVARLAQEYAPETPLLTIMRAQIGDCPKRLRDGLKNVATRTARPSRHCSPETRNARIRSREAMGG